MSGYQQILTARAQAGSHHRIRRRRDSEVLSLFTLGEKDELDTLAEKHWQIRNEG
ncbi:hypothetical protein [Thermoactinomyces mirandus]|uniref:hypothetical protein n=1 Tax=Thermoactinomyces mirandus TaxID=2756294 RepID=UPI0015EE4A34|nr:hypothetical protein [Thermoactinomyces mirandus]